MPEFQTLPIRVELPAKVHLLLAVVDSDAQLRVKPPVDEIESTPSPTAHLKNSFALQIFESQKVCGKKVVELQAELLLLFLLVQLGQKLANVID